MVRIGEEVTEELEFVPARFFIKRYIRPKFAPKSKEGVFIRQLPMRLIDNPEKLWQSGKPRENLDGRF